MIRLRPANSTEPTLMSLSGRNSTVWAWNPCSPKSASVSNESKRICRFSNAQLIPDGFESIIGLHMRIVCVVLLIAAGLLPFAFGQTTAESLLLSRQQKVFPGATAFSPKQTSPVPHYIAYTGPD